MESKKKQQDQGRDESNPKPRNEKDNTDKVDPDTNEENSLSSGDSETENNNTKNQRHRQNKEGRDEMKDDQEKHNSDTSGDEEYGEDGQPRLKATKVRNSDRAMLNELNASIEKIKEVTRTVKQQIRTKEQISKLTEDRLITLAKDKQYSKGIKELREIRIDLNQQVENMSQKLKKEHYQHIKWLIQEAKAIGQQLEDTLATINEIIEEKKISINSSQAEITAKTINLEKFEGLAHPHIYSWLKQAELYLNKTRATADSQGFFIRNHLHGEAKSRISNDIGHLSMPTKNEVVERLKLYFGDQQYILRGLIINHNR